MKTHSHDVVQRNVFCNSHDQRNLGLNSIFNCLGTLWCRHKDCRGIGFELLFRFLQVWEQRQTQVFALLAGCHASNDVGAICERVLSIASSYSSCEALVYHTCVLSV